MNKKVIHLIPQDGLGGVEQAARSLIPHPNLDIEISFLRGKTLSKKDMIKLVSGPRVNLNSLSFYINGFSYLVKSDPDVLITSLWRSSIIGIAYTLYKKFILKKEINFILFLHADRFAHKVDKLFTTLAAMLADEVWADSDATATSLLKNDRFTKKMKIISFLIRNEQLKPCDLEEKEDNFVFWGRIAKQKQLDIAIKLFSKIKLRKPESIFYIYGPDCGELEALKKLVSELNLLSNVLFMGSKKPNDYPSNAKRAKFFINTSSHEGMAIAVTEAMQLGLVPIVTPVGEIANYCIDGKNSIYYNSTTDKDILNILSDTQLYSKLSQNAMEYWNYKNDYSKDFNDNCLRVIQGNLC
ncbi:glycosyltransferase [Psychrobacter sp. GW64-MNA-CIBAN-0177]|uniref:glycosyltransferase n=1 Tax=Psychrobacter sp. GW64-MNA-CIBAN-0177 TaxID=3140449 RepID=UPI00331F2540